MRIQATGSVVRNGDPTPRATIAPDASETPVAQLLARVPEFIAPACHSDESPFGLGTAVTCDTIDPVAVSYTLMADMVEVDAAFAGAQANMGVTPIAASCEEGPFVGRYEVAGLGSGQILCTTTGTEQVFVWSRDDLPILAFAVSDTFDFPQLHAWWLGAGPTPEIAGGGHEPMCFDHDSHPPIAPMAGAAIDSRSLELVASDGNRLTAFAADAPAPTGAGIVVLPDVRGLHPYYHELALRFAEAGVDAIAFDYFGRTARRPIGARGSSIRRMWPSSPGRASRRTCRRRPSHPAGARAEGAVHDRLLYGRTVSFDLGSLADLGLAGVIGFYGPVVGPGRAGSPAPADVAGSHDLSGAGHLRRRGSSIPPEAIATFDRALSDAGVEHSLVTYPDTPHSFFDRKQAEFADASAAAWGEVLDSSGSTRRRPEASRPRSRATLPTRHLEHDLAPILRAPGGGQTRHGPCRGASPSRSPVSGVPPPPAGRSAARPRPWTLSSR